MTHMYFSARAEGRISYCHLGRTNSCFIYLKFICSLLLFNCLMKCIACMRTRPHVPPADGFAAYACVCGFDLELLGPGLGFGTKPSHV